MARMRTWVVSDASGGVADECTFTHFWTPNGLTTGAGRAQRLIEDAKRCGWKDTIAVQAPTHREAVVKACAVFTKRRQQRVRS